MTDNELPEEPYIERPDEHEVMENQLFCWIQWNRECGGDCVAYEEMANADQRMTFCKTLNAIRSTALSFNGMTRAVHALLEGQQKQAKKQAASALKAEIDKIPPPPKVNP